MDVVSDVFVSPYGLLHILISGLEFQYLCSDVYFTFNELSSLITSILSSTCHRLILECIKALKRESRGSKYHVYSTLRIVVSTEVVQL